MKKILLIIAFILNLFVLLAQNSNKTNTMQDILMSHIWEVYNYGDRSSYVAYSKTYESNKRTVTDDPKAIEYGVQYYLSETADPIFDKAKLGESTEGRYIVLNYSSGSTVSKTHTIHIEIIELTDEKLKIRHLIKGMSNYRTISTYTAKPKPNTGWPNVKCDVCNKDVNTSPKPNSIENCKCVPKISITTSNVNPNIGDTYTLTANITPKHFSNIPVVFGISVDGTNKWTQIRGFGGPQFIRRAILLAKCNGRSYIQWY